MSKNWESIFTTWAKGPAATETTRCENSIKAIKAAIGNSDILKNRSIDVFLQGSYRNRVNIRQDSDVDVGIVCNDTFFYNLPPDTTASGMNIDPAAYGYSQFKNEVEQALISYFGISSVTRGNKAFDIKANTYRVEADVAPFFEYRHYTDTSSCIKGVKLKPDRGGEVINYPERHYEKGVSKNDNTSRRYKRCVRILKNLKCKMEEEGSLSAKALPGFLIECMVYNVPDDAFVYADFNSIVKYVLAHIFNNTRPTDDCSKWTEVNDFKYLFHSSQPWTKAQAHQFVSEAWNYLGYE